MPVDPIAKPIPWLYMGLWNDQDQGGFGYKVQIHKGARCPCGNTPDSPNNINCAVCGGVGIMYPEKPIEFLAMVSDVTQHMELVEQGLMNPGDLHISPQPGTVHVDQYDLVLLPWSIGEPSYPDVFEHTGNVDTVDYRVMMCEGAWTVDPTSGNVTSYEPNTDFTYSGKNITWIGNEPAVGEMVSIRYDAQFEWVAFNPPTPRVAFGQDLGQTAILRKRHIILPNAPVLLEG